jgi:hypothetical protein
MKSWQKALALALGLPSTIIGIFLVFQQLVEKGLISQTVATIILVLSICSILFKMIQVTWKKK